MVESNATKRHAEGATIALIAIAKTAIPRQAIFLFTWAGCHSQRPLFQRAPGLEAEAPNIEGTGTEAPAKAAKTEMAAKTEGDLAHQGVLGIRETRVTAWSRRSHVMMMAARSIRDWAAPCP